MKWQKFLDEKNTRSQAEEKVTLLKNLYYFWIPSYTVIFRIRVDGTELEKRIPKGSLHTHDLDHSQPLDKLYDQVITADRLNTLDIWNHKSIDESAQEVLKKISDLKLL